MNFSKLRFLTAWLFALVIQSTAQAETRHTQKNTTCHLDQKGKYITIGGIKQWISVRGKNCQNPIILMLHGGPGSALSLYHDSLFKDWEEQFTIVHWDQRGTGKTFEVNHPKAQTFQQLLNEPLTIETLVNDGLAVTDYIRKTYQSDTVILMGTSWGAFLGLKMAFVAPEKYSAYLGSSPLINFHSNTSASYALVLSEARQRQDNKTIALLNALGKPPWKSPKKFKQLRMTIRQYAQSDVTPLPSLTTEADYADAHSRTAYETGEDFSFLKFLGLKGDGMANNVRLDECCLHYQTPIYLFQGEHDRLSIPSITHAFYDQLSAPTKSYTVVPHTGHELNQFMLDAQFAALKQMQHSTENH